MSAIEDFRLEFAKSNPKLYRELVAAAKRKARYLKLQRRGKDRILRDFMRRHFDKKTRKWDSMKNTLYFRRQMAERHHLHQRIARLVPEKKDPEFDSP